MGHKGASFVPLGRSWDEPLYLAIRCSSLESRIEWHACFLVLCFERWQLARPSACSSAYRIELAS